MDIITKWYLWPSHNYLVKRSPNGWSDTVRNINLTLLMNPKQIAANTEREEFRIRTLTSDRIPSFFATTTRQG